MHRWAFSFVVIALSTAEIWHEFRDQGARSEAREAARLISRYWRMHYDSQASLRAIRNADRLRGAA